MKYSFNLGQYYFKADLSKIRKLNSAEFAEKLNAQIGAFDEIIDWGARYEGIYVVKIAKVDKHSDADKLNVCLVDDGGADKKVDRVKDGLIQVVCGAPNVKAGLTAVWISPGATAPSTFDDKEPFVLSKVKLRGIDSNGMLASAKELDLSSDHSGILELNPEEVDVKLLKPGTPFKELFGLDDIIVDFENKMFTHRPDCFGHLGLAREMAGIQGINFKSPDWYKNFEPVFPKADSKLKVKVYNQCPEVTPRYMAAPVEGVKVAPSPVWLQSYLTRLGIRPINNIVDVTNYVMILTGQPLHAFDYDKLKGSSSDVEIVVRSAKSGEKIRIISAKEVDLDKSDIVITDGKSPVALGGVMGGASSEVDEKTANIVLESATFDMYSIRRTSMRHGIFTDAVTRYTKGQPAAQTAVALLKAIEMIQELIPGSKSGEVSDSQKDSFDYDHLNIEVSKINKILGLELGREQVAKILNYVEIYSHEMLDEVCVTPPFWRTDLEIDEDVIEEIGRLYGFNKIDAELPVRRVAPARKNPMIELKQAIRGNLSSHGANEVLTYNFVNENLLKRAGQDPEMAYKIRNALSPDLQRYRLSMVPTLLDKVHMNIKAGEDEFALFELGKSHIKEHIDEQDKLPVEYQHLSFIYANKNKIQGAPYFVASRYLEELLGPLGVEFKLVEMKEDMFGSKHPLCSPFQYGRTAGIEIDGQLRGLIGEFTPEVYKNFKLPESSAGFELDLGFISENFSLDPSYKPLNKFPSISQDISIESKAEEPYSAIEGELLTVLAKSAKKAGLEFKVVPVSIFQKDGSNTKSTTFSIEFWHPERTLTSAEISKITSAL